MSVSHCRMCVVGSGFKVEKNSWIIIHCRTHVLAFVERQRPSSDKCQIIEQKSKAGDHYTDSIV